MFYTVKCFCHGVCSLRNCRGLFLLEQRSRELVQFLVFLKSFEYAFLVKTVAGDEALLRGGPAPGAVLYLRKLDPHVRARVRRGLEELLQHLLRFDIKVRCEEYLGEHLELRRIRRAVGERTDELRRLADASELEERVRERHALDARQRPGAALRLERVDLREERTQRLHVAAQVRGALVVRVEVVGVVQFGSR